MITILVHGIAIMTSDPYGALAEYCNPVTVDAYSSLIKVVSGESISYSLPSLLIIIISCGSMSRLTYS